MRKPASGLLPEDVLRELFSKVDHDNLPESPPNYPPIKAWDKIPRPNDFLRLWEESLALNPGKNPVVYAHFPFCSSLCTFCGFYRKIPDRTGEMGRFLSAMKTEIGLFRPIFKGNPLRYLCFGGGTPSMLPPKELAVYLGMMRDGFHVVPETKVTLEASPASVSLEKLRVMKEHGVDWLAFGVQSFDERLLRGMRRYQKPEQVHKAIEWARQAGIGHINIDLMVGLPGQTEESFLADVRTVSEMDLERVYIFDFQSRSRTSIEGTSEGGSIDPQGVDRARALRGQAFDSLIAKGYRMACGHQVFKRNGSSWPYSYDKGEEGCYSILGLGPTAISYAMDRARYINSPHEAAYERTLRGGLLPVEKGFVLSRKDEMRSTVIVDCLHRGGVNTAEFSKRYGVDVRKVFGAEIGGLEKDGILVDDGRSIYITNWSKASFFVRKAFYAPPLVKKLMEAYGIKQAPTRKETARQAGPVVIRRMSKSVWECHLGEKCTLDCAFCFKNGGPRDRDRRSVLSELYGAAKEGYTEIVFTGGEPCLDENLDFYIKFSAKLGIKNISLWTNGLACADKSYASGLVRSGLNGVIVGLASHLAEKNERLSGSPLQAAAAAEAARNFSELGISVRCSIVLLRANVDGVVQTMDFMREKGARGFMLVFPRYLGNMKASSAAKDGLAVRYGDLRGVISQAVSFSGDRGVSLEFLNLPLCIIHPHWEYAGDMVALENGGDARETDFDSPTVKTKECLSCRFLLKCSGQTPDYVGLFGRSNHPIK